MQNLERDSPSLCKAPGIPSTIAQEQGGISRIRKLSTGIEQVAVIERDQDNEEIVSVSAGTEGSRVHWGDLNGCLDGDAADERLCKIQGKRTSLSKLIRPSIQ